jgi:hypothetical protein
MELEKRGATKSVLTQWVQDAEKMDKWLPRKITVVGFCRMLQMPPASLPPSVLEMIPNIISMITTLTGKIEEEANNEGAGEDDLPTDGGAAAMGGTFAPSGEYFEGFEEDEDVHSLNDDAYLDAMKNYGGDDVARFLMGDNWFGDDEDDDDEFISPLDDVETLTFYRDSLRAAFEREPSFYQEVQKKLPEGTVTMCQNLFMAADGKSANGQ